MDTEVISNYYGQKIAVHRNDEISRAIIKKGVYDPWGLYYIRQILKRLSNPIVMDVGANVGNHAIVLAELCDYIYMFEPQIENIKLLRETMTLNNVSNFKLFEFGLGDNETTELFYQNASQNNGASTYVKGLKGEQYNLCKLPIKKGDNVLKHESIDKVDLIKIDVEGYEAKVIRGLKDTIKRNQPIIIIEWNNDYVRDEFRKYDLFNSDLENYHVKALVSNYQDSQWNLNPFNKMLRKIYAQLVSEYYFIDSFYSQESYNQIFLYPSTKSDIVSAILRENSKKNLTMKHILKLD